MATLRLTTPPLGVFRFAYTVTLDGSVFSFFFRWNRRDSSFYLDIGDDNGVAVVRDVRMVLATDVLAPYKSVSVPQGSLNIVDTSNADLEATLEDFGDRVQLQYVEVGT